MEPDQTHRQTLGDARRITAKTAEDIADMVRASASVADMFGEALKAIDADLSFTHWTLLDLLRRDGPMRPFQAAARLKLSRQLVFQTAKKLGRLGYIEFDSEQDRRAVMISVSPQGMAILSQVEAGLEAIADGMNERAPTASLRPLRNMLAFIANGLSRDGGQDGDRTAEQRSRPS